jgi:prolyl oligopeptidase
VFTLDGRQTGTINYPGLGSASEVFGREDSNHGFYSFDSFNIPPAVYHYDAGSGRTEVFAKPTVPFNSDDYEVKQVFYKSKDGTRIPMFISSKKGVKRDGTAQALMYAYGGFLLSETPHWNPEYAWWIEQGGFFAQPNLRGGGEYGEGWHKAGMFEKKQNVFDDFFAAAEYLIANKYTSSDRFAIRGRSNGGLLMGAALTQRPDLFGAIWVGYPLLDMIRFHKFLGDSDTRVAPLHARKMTALLQATNGSDRPVLLHYELNAGHSSGVSIKQLVDDTADELAFLWNETSGK